MYKNNFVIYSRAGGNSGDVSFDDVDDVNDVEYEEAVKIPEKFIIRYNFMI